MRIGFDAKRAFRNFTGLGNYSRFVIQGLYEYFPEDTYILFTPNSSVNQETSFLTGKGKIIEPSGLFKAGVGKGIWRSVFSLSLAADIDVFHGLSNELPWIDNPNVRKVVTIHDLLFIRYPELYSRIDRWIYTRKAKRACRVADVVIAVSSQTKEDVVTMLGIPEEKIKVIYQGCNEMFYRTGSGEQLQMVRQKYSLPNQYLLSVGTIEERKNALVILKSLVELPPEINLVLVGRPTKYRPINSVCIGPSIGRSN